MTNLIKTNDLRLGNWITGVNTYEEKSSYFQVEKISREGINGEHINARLTKYARYIEPIPLSASILEAAGFKNVQTDIYRKKIKVSGGWVAVIDILQIDSTVYCYEKRWCQFHYLHQIQNLYYSLIKEELTINLNQLQQA